MMDSLRFYIKFLGLQLNKFKHLAEFSVFSTVLNQKILEENSLNFFCSHLPIISTFEMGKSFSPLEENKKIFFGLIKFLFSVAFGISVGRFLAHSINLFFFFGFLRCFFSQEFNLLFSKKNKNC